MRVFKLSNKEEERADAFIKKHKHPTKEKGAIGGHIEYILSPTGLGLVVTMRCKICKQEKGITDFDNW